MSKIQSGGLSYCPAAFEGECLEQGRSLVSGFELYGAFIARAYPLPDKVSTIEEFISAMKESVAKIALAEIDVAVIWCALSLTVDKYFEYQAQSYGWTMAQAEDIKSRWFAIVGPSFFAGSGTYTLDVNAVAQWNQDYLKLISTEGEGRYGDYVRLLVFETVVLQALAGAPWQEICALPMKVNNISPEAVEAALSQRS